MDIDNLRQGIDIITEGIFEPHDIIFSYTSTILPFSNQEKFYIENQWIKLKKNKPFLFNGQLFNVLNYSINDSTIMFFICNTIFKEYVVTNNKEFKKKFGKNNIVKPLSVGSMLITNDNRWIIGRRSNTYDYEGSYDLIAGYMDPMRDIVDFIPDPFYAIRREINEECGTIGEDIENITCLGLIGQNQPYLAFVTKLKISSYKLHYKNPKEKEFSKLEDYNLANKDIQNFVFSTFNKITPHALGNILMCCNYLKL